MGLFSWVTGAKAVDKTLDITDKATIGAISGFDKMFYTKEEKAETLTQRLEIGVKAVELHLKLMEVTASETTTRSVSRRIVAIFIMVMTFMSMFLISIARMVSVEYASFLLELIKYFKIGEAFIAVVVFFFGNYLLNKFVKK